MGDDYIDARVVATWSRIMDSNEGKKIGHEQLIKAFMKHKPLKKTNKQWKYVTIAWVRSHIGITGNEKADSWLKQLSHIIPKKS